LDVMDWLLRYADPTIDWSYAMLTLIVRFVGVFVVMGVMQVALQAAARAVRVIEKRQAQRAAAGVEAAPASPLDLAAMPEGELEIIGGAVAAIAVALEMEKSGSVLAVRPAAGPSSWAIAGRMQQLHRAPR
jgi:hypothetical protein